MRLLYLTEEVPNRDPMHGNGSSMISYEVIRHLPDHVEVTLLTYRSEIRVPREIRRRCADVIMLEPRPPSRAALVSLVTPFSPGAASRTTGKARHAVAEVSAEADVTLLHGPHVTPLAHHVQGPLVLQVVDPWSLRVNMEASLAHGLRAVYRRAKASQALSAERNFPRRARLLTVGQQDAATWAERVGRPVSSIGNGVSTVAFEVVPPPVPTVSFVGSLSYQPNVESARVLVREIGPRLRASVPQMRIIIAGRQPDPQVQALASDWVEVRPNVPSVSDVFQASTVAVFADRHGLGVRNSVKEALAAGIPVVASASAAREQDPHPRLQVAADEDELVELVVAALASSRPPTTGPEPERLRSWSDVSADYLRECTQALRDRDVPAPAVGVPRSDHR